MIVLNLYKFSKLIYDHNTCVVYSCLFLKITIMNLISYIKSDCKYQYYNYIFTEGQYLSRFTIMNHYEIYQIKWQIAILFKKYQNGTPLNHHTIYTI